MLKPLAIASPALAANFYNRTRYNSAALKELSVVKDQLVALDLSYMPLKEEDAAIIAEFKNLRRLNLNFTTLPGKALASLAKMPVLSELSIAGTNSNATDLQVLATFPALKDVYAWSTEASVADFDALKKKFPKLHIIEGWVNDTLQLKLTAPVIETDTRVINGTALAVKMKHYIKGVAIRYTLDGSNPDSIHGAVYKDSLVLHDNSILKAKAFKKGWLVSDSSIAGFYRNTYRPDSILSITPLDSVYKGQRGAATLIDGEKADFANIGNRRERWLGFRRNKMEMLLHYQVPITVSNVTLSMLMDPGAYIFPPAVIEIWGGNDEHKLQRLATNKPPQPDSMRVGIVKEYNCNFKPLQLQYLKVVATPISKLPKWHSAKGQEAWLFTDEILVN